MVVGRFGEGPWRIRRTDLIRGYQRSKASGNQQGCILRNSMFPPFYTVVVELYYGDQYQE